MFVKTIALVFSWFTGKSTVAQVHAVKGYYRCWQNATTYLFSTKKMAHEIKKKMQLRTRQKCKEQHIITNLKITVSLVPRVNKYTVINLESEQTNAINNNNSNLPNMQLRVHVGTLQFLMELIIKNKRSCEKMQMIMLYF